MQDNSDFKNIVIQNDLGVSPVGNDTKIMAKNAVKYNVNNTLEVGIGTGFISIYLTKCGLKCEGTDINVNAIKCAKNNALKNGCKINFQKSNLFENIEKKYDMIIFNPPYGNTNSNFVSILEFIKSIIPKENKWIAKISFLIIKKQRHSLIEKFLIESKNYLTKNGIVLTYLHSSEMGLVEKLNFKKIDKYKELSLIQIQM
jgi:methylase of polypeptide subunit release factors